MHNLAIAAARIPIFHNSRAFFLITQSASFHVDPYDTPITDVVTDPPVDPIHVSSVAVRNVGAGAGVGLDPSNLNDGLPMLDPEMLPPADCDAAVCV